MNIIVCGCKKDHTCNELATVYETRDGKRHTFTDDSEAKKWYDENYTNVLMGSVACSICGEAMIDSAWML